MSSRYATKSKPHDFMIYPMALVSLWQHSGLRPIGIVISKYSFPCKAIRNSSFWGPQISVCMPFSSHISKEQEHNLLCPLLSNEFCQGIYWWVSQTYSLRQVGILVDSVIDRSSAGHQHLLLHMTMIIFPHCCTFLDPMTCNVQFPRH